MENSKSSYWTIDEKANEKKSYVRRRCVTLDKQTEAAARRKLVHRRVLFSQHQQQRQHQQQELCNGETPMEQDIPSGTEAFQRTGSNASQGSSSVHSEFNTATTTISSGLKPSAPSETVPTAAAVTTPDSPDGNHEVVDDFEKARLELALLVAESCYINSNCKNSAPNAAAMPAPTPGQVKLPPSRPSSLGMSGMPSSLPPPLKPSLLFQPQQMLQRFSFEEFLNEQQRKKDPQQQQPNQRQLPSKLNPLDFGPPFPQQQPWRPPTSPGLLSYPSFRGQPTPLQSQGQMFEQQQQQSQRNLQLSFQQQPSQVTGNTESMAVLATSSSVDINEQQQQQQYSHVFPLQAEASTEQLKHETRPQIHQHQQHQQKFAKNVLQHRFQQLRLQQMQQQQQQKQPLQTRVQTQSPQQMQNQQHMLQMHLQPQPQQQNQQQMMTQECRQQHQQEQNSVLQQIHFLQLQQRDRSLFEAGCEVTPKCPEAKKIDGTEEDLENTSDPIMDICTSWQNSPQTSPSTHLNQVPHNARSASPFRFQCQQPTYAASAVCNDFETTSHIDDMTRSNSLAAICSSQLPANPNPVTSLAVENGVCDVRGSRSLDDIPCSLASPPPTSLVEGVTNHPQYFRFADPAKAAQFEPHRTC